MKRFLIVLCILWVGFIFWNSMNPGYVSHKDSFAIVNFLRNKKSQIEKLDGCRSNVNDKSNKSNAGGNPSSHGTSPSDKDNVSNLPSTRHDVMLDFIIRKNAHAFEYFVLAFIVSGILFSYGFKGRGSLVYIMFICLLCAVLDEFSQKFSVSRTSSVGDVLIDFSGSLIGILIFYIVYYSKFFRRIKNAKRLQ